MGDAMLTKKFGTKGVSRRKKQNSSMCSCSACRRARSSPSFTGARRSSSGRAKAEDMR